MDRQREHDDPYLSGVYRWWHLSGPSPELQEAVADSWIDVGARVLDVGCGLGTELGWLAAQQQSALAVGLDRSVRALGRLRAERPAVSVVAADVLALPFQAASFRTVLDRGCYHYLYQRLPGVDRRRDGAEVARVVMPGGRLLLRACLTSDLLT
jgi:SAM-dependent methyltransferase